MSILNNSKDAFKNSENRDKIIFLDVTRDENKSQLK